MASVKTAKDNCKINILGEVWDVEYVSVRDKRLLPKNLWGSEDSTHKKLLISDCADTPILDDRRVWQKETERHEIIHTFLRAAGYDKYNHDEVLVSMLDSLLPKMAKVMIDMGCFD